MNSLPRMMESERERWKENGYRWMKAITEQVSYYHDLGIVVNALMIDQVREMVTVVDYDYDDDDDDDNNK